MISQTAIVFSNDYTDLLYSVLVCYDLFDFRGQMASLSNNITYREYLPK